MRCNMKWFGTFVRYYHTCLCYLYLRIRVCCVTHKVQWFSIPVNLMERFNRVIQQKYNSANPQGITRWVVALGSGRLSGYFYKYIIPIKCGLMAESITSSADCDTGSAPARGHWRAHCRRALCRPVQPTRIGYLDISTTPGVLERRQILVLFA